MKTRSSFAKFLGVILTGALLIGVTACETASSTPSGPVGPTVKVTFESQPAAAIIINERDVGVTPTTVNLEVDDKGQLIYTHRITWDFTKTGNARAASKDVDWPAGRVPPAKVTYISNNVSESREYAPANPPGTRSSVERRD